MYPAGCPHRLVRSIPDDLGDLPAAAEVAAYRIIDEALANVVKHAETGHAGIRVVRGRDRLVIDVSDDGRGTG